eukprot:m.489959 g.489959  ORF g.489959 m.489959 type:complete len:468 (+) comp27307_c0_seq1:195-1598(+)
MAGGNNGGEAALAFLQAEHAQTLQSLHARIHELQQQNSDLTLALTMPTSSPTTTVGDDDDVSRVSQLESLVVSKDQELAELREQLAVSEQQKREALNRVTVLQSQISQLEQRSELQQRSEHQQRLETERAPDQYPERAPDQDMSTSTPSQAVAQGRLPCGRSTDTLNLEQVVSSPRKNAPGSARHRRHRIRPSLPPGASPSAASPPPASVSSASTLASAQHGTTPSVPPVPAPPAAPPAADRQSSRVSSSLVARRHSLTLPPSPDYAAVPATTGNQDGPCTAKVLCTAKAPCTTADHVTVSSSQQRKARPRTPSRRHRRGASPPAASRGPVQSSSPPPPSSASSPPPSSLPGGARQCLLHGSLVTTPPGVGHGVAREVRVAGETQVLQRVLAEHKHAHDEACSCPTTARKVPPIRRTTKVASTSAAAAMAGLPMQQDPVGFPSQDRADTLAHSKRTPALQGSGNSAQ